MNVQELNRAKFVFNRCILTLTNSGITEKLLTKNLGFGSYYRQESFESEAAKLI